VVDGDDHCEAYTTIVWGSLLSREKYYAAEAEADSRDARTLPLLQRRLRSETSSDTDRESASPCDD
jgi:hypothetical protein